MVRQRRHAKQEPAAEPEPEPEPVAEPEPEPAPAPVPEPKCHHCHKGFKGKHNQLFIACRCKEPEKMVHAYCYIGIAAKGGVDKGERCPDCGTPFPVYSPHDDKIGKMIIDFFQGLFLILVILIKCFSFFYLLNAISTGMGPGVAIALIVSAM